MESTNTSLSERVSSFYKQLSVAASDLNAASDELGEVVSSLDAALKKLNLGVSTWLDISRTSDDYGNYWRHQLGYSKIGNRWGVALRIFSGNYNDPEPDSDEVWLYNDAPRQLRIEGIERIPELLEKLILETKKTATRIKDKTAQAKQLTTAITEVASAGASRQK